MITKEIEEITRDAQELEALLQQAELPAQIQMEPCESQIGGGSLPLERIPKYGCDDSSGKDYDSRVGTSAETYVCSDDRAYNE